MVFFTLTSTNRYIVHIMAVEVIIMNNDKLKIAIIGGDLRQLVVAKELAADGFETALFGFDNTAYGCGDAVRCLRLSDALNEAGVVILPVPFSQDNCRINSPLTKNEIRLEELFSCLDGKQLIFAGLCNSTLENYASEKGALLIDYMKCEELNVLNAVPTAEGAIEVALRELPKTLHSSKILITGFGRIGKLLASMLSGMGNDVTVCARSSESIAWIRALGYKYIHTDSLKKNVFKYDLVFNTVPTVMFTPPILREAKKGLLIVDLASRPGGVDGDYAEKCGVNVIWALSLPGKCSPVTAGEIIKETVCDIMKKRGVIS